MRVILEVWPEAIVKQDYFHVLKRFSDAMPHNHSARGELQG